MPCKCKFNIICSKDKVLTKNYLPKSFKNDQSQKFKCWIFFSDVISLQKFAYAVLTIHFRCGKI